MGCRTIGFGDFRVFPATRDVLLPGRRSLALPWRELKRGKKPCLASTDEAILSFLEYEFTSSIDSLRQFLATVPNAPEITVLALALTAVGSSLVYGGRSGSSSQGFRAPGQQGSPDSWFLTLNPTPFNKFVMARCPSICFASESPADDDVHQKLNLASNQVVTLENGESSTWEAPEMDYQRKCIPAEDGGVLALDWPVSLDLEADHGLDTTLVLIPGTAKGSRDETVKVFAQRALKAGYFPVILNPRGCGNSPLTTPRLYSAGDSDDVRAGVSYVSRVRPWTTLMGIAWGYGANMLTKYLGEEENLTPLTAAVSMNNPFDLNEATKFMKTNAEFHDEVTDGFVEILKSNKMLFQGKQDIDVGGGLIATSVREFENAVSRPATGFKTLDVFYRSSSCGRLVHQVKTPLLCIQDASAVPLYSIPQDVFEGNPFTTLLYTTLESKQLNGAVIINLALEWLAAVELAFLKGRHPLLRGVDLAIKPSKEWSANIRGEVIDGNEFIEIDSSEDAWRTTADQPVSETLLLNDASKNGALQEQQQAVSTTDQQQEVATPDESEEQSQALQTAARTVFGALDVAMPGTLSDEMKEQVLDAVSRGESIITALQNAVPEDVRGKMATAVSAAVQARGMSLQLVGFGKNLPPPTLPAGLKESLQDKLGSIAKGLPESNSDTSSDAQPAHQGPVESEAKSEPEPVSSDADPKTEQNSESTNSNDADAAPKSELNPESSNNDDASLKTEQKMNSDTKLKSGQTTEEASGEKQESPKSEADARTQADNPQEASKRGEAAPPAPASDSKPGGGSPGRNSEGNAVPPITASSINMQQAFQALSGLDDSTQMAVNNVFGVLEGMLEQIQSEKQDEHLEFQREQDTHQENSKLGAPSNAEQTGQEQRDELRDVHSRLKKTRISGFILHDNKVPMKGEAAPALEFSRARATEVLYEAIKVEVQRRAGAESLEASPVLREELLRVAEAVLKEVQNVRVFKDSSSREVLSAEGLVNAVALAFRETSTLKQVIPFGVLVGVILASLVNSFVVVTDAEGGWQHIGLSKADASLRGTQQAPAVVAPAPIPAAAEQALTPAASEQATAKKPAPVQGQSSRGGYGNVVQAVTAAMGATAAFANSGSNEKREEEEDEGDDDSYTENIVRHIAEKAFSIAAPVVPTKDGQIDHDRLVSMLTDISHKAGFLSFLGKAALLWGGLRGAMSVTDRLLVFLRISERPLHQRLAGFVGMVLLLWSPVVVPLLPALLNEWAAKSSGGVAQYASVAGLYGAVILLIIIWGKKIRGYEHPLHSYGLNLKKMRLFAAGVVAGCGAVSVLYSMFNKLGYLKFAPSFLVAATLPQLALSVGKLLKLVAEGVLIGVGLSVVEELLFRSWLMEEISVDLGHHKAILLSSFVFAIVHRTPSAIPGLWFLGIALAGARFRAAGNLALPIGLHAGLIAANFVLNCGGFLVYSPAPNWMTGAHGGTPLAGALGATIAGISALLLYPCGTNEETG